ncbi:tetratricopeptide repeat protein [Saccharopolyspora erythraea]|uniref:tetratricopeptide repeat protein n=1 Tax=Saccharopolyspora erythraea TaxID=1836 RepID=UPI001BAC5DC0|nr:tetratricopeptide repeat protein [Saccharopolyspora erythraea]QUH05569.1 tetratricopeptide repeat protein [Saccharopolyspora erythraea]
MKPRSAEAARFARELEAELDEYPDERAEILTDAADQWHRAGDHDRAVQLLEEAIAHGGEDGANARVGMAEVLFDLGRDDEARAQLDALRHQRPPSPVPYHLAAELLEERADHQNSLTWFNMAVSRLSEQEMADLDHEFAAFSHAGSVLVGRRRVREALGIPPDELDESAPPVGPDPFDDIDALIDGPADDVRPPAEVRVLFWPRGEVARAHEIWPRLVEHGDPEATVRDRERANRELSEAGVGRITMVPLTTTVLIEFAARTGGDPTDETTRRACMDEIVEAGRLITWPPARNAPCWCGAAAKYKKCCGRPHLD